MASLAEIRARLAAADNKQGNQISGGDNAIYPHWNMQEGKEAVIRFLPDSDQSNTFFWAERAMIKLPFAGVKGDTDWKWRQLAPPLHFGETAAAAATPPIEIEKAVWDTIGHFVLSVRYG